MNTVTTIKLDRPPNIGENDPVPIPINNTLEIQLQALWQSGSPVNLTGAKIYVTIKAALADLDASAKLQKNSTTHPTYFSIDSAAAGLYRVIIPAGDLVTAALAINTNYYIDTEIIPSGGAVFTHLYDTIRPFQQVTIIIT